MTEVEKKLWAEVYAAEYARHGGVVLFGDANCHPSAYECDGAATLAADEAVESFRRAVERAAEPRSEEGS